MACMATGWAWAQGGPAADNAPNATGAAADPRAYVIGPQDVIGVRVFRNRDFSGTYIVRADSKIVLPLVGAVEAGGQTTKQLESRIIEALSAYIDKPDVSVFIQRIGARPTPSPAK
jgi:polysaccharide biosynthesis/export protein